MTDRPIQPFPESKAADVGSASAQALAGIVPFSGAVSPFLAMVIGAPLERRRVAWLNRLGDGLREIEARFDGFDPKELGDNEDFVSAIVETSEAAMKASNEAKRARLANVVLNIAVGKSVTDALRGRFIGMLQTFSEEHILLLRICHAPASFPRVEAAGRNIHIGAKMGAYRTELAEHGISDEVTDLIAKDLETEGLIHGGLKAMGSGASILTKATTGVGDAFLTFISSPLDD